MELFDYGEIVLQDGMLDRALKEVMEFYLNIPNDNILKYIRESAGKEAPGIYYQGWFVNSKGVSLLGQWLSAFSRMYAVTKNPAFRDKALFLDDEFWDCYERTKNSAQPFFNSRSHYNIEKLLRAECDMHVYLQAPKAEERAAYLVDFADRILETENIFGNNMTEWYTLPESFLIAYDVFGLKLAKKVAEKFEYREYWEIFQKDEYPFSKHPQAGFYSEFCHAYSHVNSFVSCAKVYQETKNPALLKALRSFYRFMQEEEVMVTGGYGPNFEHLMPKNRIIDALRTGHDSFETQCDSYAAYRLCGYLYSITGEPQFGDWVEKLMYNATLSTLPMTEDGRVVYYSDYNMYGATKFNRADGWTCCTGTRPLLLPELLRLIYMKDERGIFVSQYLPSTIQWEKNGQEISIRQKTAFPTEEKTQLEISAAFPVKFALRLRIPSWLGGKMSVSVNGKEETPLVDEKGWLVMDREWNPGDRVTVFLPKKLAMHSFDLEKNGPNAFTDGPIVLAATYTGIQTPNDWMDVQSLLEGMHPVEGKPMHYTVDGIDTITFKPFYEYAENERYFLYHDTTAHATKIHVRKKKDLTAY